MNSLDILAIAIIGVALVQAFTKGTAAELGELAAAVAGLLAALLFYESLEMLLLKMGVGNPMAAMLGFVSIFLAFIILGALGSARIRKALGKRELSWRDRLWGSFLGLARGFVINSVLFLVLQVFPVNPGLMKTSVTAPFFLTGSGIIKSIAPDSFRLLVPGEEGYELMKPSKSKQPAPDGKPDGGVPDENTIERI